MWERADFSTGERADTVDLARAAYEWVDRHREPPPIWHPDGEFLNAREDPDHAIYSGPEAVHKQNYAWIDAFPDLRVEPLEIRANGDLVFVWLRFRGRGARSGAAMQTELAHVVTIAGGKMRRIQEYYERAAGQRAVGLEE
jgi:ketosteroid isomerase-like protein